MALQDGDINIRKTIAETLKLAAEEQKLRAEAHRLEAKDRKLGIDRYIAPLAGIGAFIGAAIGAFSLIYRLLGPCPCSSLT
jgi:hypothetical protein